MLAVHADAIVTGDGEAIRDGAVVVDVRGEVVSVGSAADVLPRHQGIAVNRVHGVVLPGLVNAHTHLELSALHGRAPGGAGFVPWVEQLIGVRAELHPEEDSASIAAAIDQLDAAGTVAVGEVTNSLAAVEGLARRGFAGCIFHELFGIERAALEQRVEGLGRFVEERLGKWPSDELAYAATPHTLYTTHPEVVRRLLRETREKGKRSSIHLAEHASERRFLQHGDGPVADWYESRLKIRRDRLEWPSRSPIAFADELGALDPSVLAVHLTDARKDEIELVARRGSPVVLCPRSNLHIEMRLPPLLALRAAGITPALGTDSLASNASLDVLAEARALADRFPTVPAVELLRMATWEGGRALGCPTIGRIARGGRPGLFAIEGACGADPCAFVLANVRSPRRWIVRRTMEAA